MIRKQFFIDEEQNRKLKALAERTGRSEAEIIREGLATVIDRPETVGKTKDDGEGWREAFGIWRDRDDLDDFYASRRSQRNARRSRMESEGPKGDPDPEAR